MSQYTNFFVRSKSDEFLPIGYYSSSTYVAGAFREIAPYGKIKALNFDLMHEARSQLDELLQNTVKLKLRTEERRNAVATFNNSCEEKAEIYEDLGRDIEVLNEDIDDIREAISVVRVLHDIISNIRHNDNYNDDEYLYVGIEIGSPTIDDIT